jgi:PadR family transcriptional regulator PadR
MRADHVSGQMDLLLLSALARGPAHGYAVISRLHQSSNGFFDLPEGAVYPALHRLERDGLLASRWDESGERRRRVYEVTPAGLGALAAKKHLWQLFARGMQTVVRGTA